MVYKVFSDERYSSQLKNVFYIGGVVCTQERTNILNEALNQIRIDNHCSGEYKWTKISNYHLTAYEQWVKTFFHDPYARFMVLRIHKESDAWLSFQKKEGYREALRSIYYQFLIRIFKTRQDDKISWNIYHDFGFFSKESDISQVEFKLNRTYKKLAPKRKRVISISQTVDSRQHLLVQLSDILLGASDFILSKNKPVSIPKSKILSCMADSYVSNPVTVRHMDKITVYDWVNPTGFDYSSFKKVPILCNIDYH